MRETYHAQLEELATNLADMCATVGHAMAEATAALLDSDPDAAERVIAGDAAVDDKRSETEENAYALLALQAPVASELRAVLAAIHAAESLERMGDLARHVAKTARRRYPDSVIPRQVRPQFERMGEVATQQAHAAERVIRKRDLDLAHTIEEADDEMDELHRSLFGVLMSSDWAYGVPSAVDLTQLSRFYERFADHAVSVARRMEFVVTGRMPDSASSGV